MSKANEKGAGSRTRRATVTPAAEQWLTEEGLFLIECWARDMTQQEVAIKKMGISETTLVGWKTRYPEIAKAMQKGKEIVDYRVESALLKRALGFKTKKVKTVISGNQDKDGNRPIRIETMEEEVLPDTTAILAWLNNRKPDSWKRNRDNVLTTTDDDNHITVNIIRAGSNQKPKSSKSTDEDDEWDVSSSKEEPKTGKASSLNLKEKRTKEEKKEGEMCECE